MNLKVIIYNYKNFAWLLEDNNVENILSSITIITIIILQRVYWGHVEAIILDTFVRNTILFLKSAHYWRIVKRAYLQIKKTLILKNANSCLNFLIAHSFRDFDKLTCSPSLLLLNLWKIIMNLSCKRENRSVQTVRYNVLFYLT